MTTTGNERHLRMVFLLVKGGTEMTKRLFEKRVVDLKPINHNSNLPWTVDEFLYQNKDLILSSNKGKEKETVYFPGPCDKTDLSKWDLIMFCFILTRICNLSNSILKDVEELRDMRNKICHVTDPTLEESKFEKKLRNFKVIAENICKDINDASFEKHINELIDNIKTDPLSTSEIVKMTHKFYTMERENKAILTEHSKDHKEMLEKLTRIESKVDNTTSANAVKLPETDVEILVQNCNKDKEKKLSQILVKLIDEKIQERTDLVEELSNEDLAKLREAVAEAVEMFLTNGRKITSTENKCVLVRVQCLSVGSLAALFRDCISRELTNQLKPIEKAVRGLKGYEEVNLVAIIYEDEFWKVMRKTISVLEDYVQSEENKPRAVVSMQCAQAASRENEGTPFTLNIHYPSSVQRDILREAFTKGEIDRRMKKIQDAVGPEYSNVKITARLKRQVELSPEVYYASTKRCTKRVKKKKNGKRNKGTLSEMVSSMMISKSGQKTKEETDDLKSCSGEGDAYSVEDVTTMVCAEESDFSKEAAPVLSSFWDRTSDTNYDSGTKMSLSYSDTDKYSNVKITARLKQQVELSPEVYYASTKRCTKRVKKKKNGKRNKGTLSEMVSSMMISKSGQKTKEETDDLKSCSGEGDAYSVEDVTTMVYAEESDFSKEAAPVLSSFWDRTSDTNYDSGTKMILSYSDTVKKNINAELGEMLQEREVRLKDHEVRHNDIEQYTRRNSVRIYGIEDNNKDETIATSRGLVVKLLKEKLQIDIQPTEIDTAHRLGKFQTDGNRPIICKFVSTTLKREVVGVRRKLKGSKIIIREDLTTKNAKILEKAFAREEVKAAWSDEGQIKAVLLNGKKVTFDLLTDWSKPLIAPEELARLKLENSKSTSTP